jgi:hypothetical protein
MISIIGLKGKEVAENMFAYRAAFLRVELCAEEVVFLKCSAKWNAVLCLGNGAVAELRVIGVNVIDVTPFIDAAEEWAAQACYGVPAHVGDFQ